MAVDKGTPAAGGTGDGDPREEPAPTPLPTPLGERSVPVHWFAGRLHEVIDDLVDPVVAVAGLDVGSVAETVTELTAAVHRLQALRAAVLTRGEVLDVAATTGATSTQAWFAHATTSTHRQARKAVKLAAALDRHEPTAVELAAGRIGPEQAEVILAAVDALPASVGAADRERAEKHLLVEAGTHDAHKLKVLGKRLLEVIDPEAADAELARLLDAEERNAARKTFFTLTDNGDGTCQGRYRIPTLQAMMLLKGLHAFASPARPDGYDRQTVEGTSIPPAFAADTSDHEVDPETGEQVVRMKTTAELLGEAFCEYIERFPVDKLPTAGGVNATVVVTMPLQALTDGLAAAGLDTGEAISAAQARRLACQAGIIPAVLGSKSEVLDLGRSRRLHSKAQRIALGLRDAGCTAEGCDRPAGWCHAHHDIPWGRGGSTDVKTGRLLCRRHHTLIHHRDYTAEITAGNRVRLTKTTHRRQ